jgi:hypothetical protein
MEWVVYGYALSVIIYGGLALVIYWLYEDYKYRKANKK